MSRTYACPFCTYVTGHYAEEKSAQLLGVHLGLRHRNVARVVVEEELRQRRIEDSRRALARVEWP